jgi:hypothetical protein
MGRCGWLVETIVQADRKMKLLRKKWKLCLVPLIRRVVW